MLFYFVLFLAFLLAWQVFNPSWNLGLKKSDLPAQWGTFKQNSSGWLNTLKAKFTRQASLGASLRAWAFNQDLDVTGNLSSTQLEELTAFRLWLQSLPESDVDEVGRELSDFCLRRKVDIRWLLDDHGAGDMQSVLSVLVLYFGLAVRERMDAQPAAALRAWQEAPGSRKNREFGERLYVELVNHGRISIPASLLFTPEKTRRQHLVQELQSLITTDRDALLIHARRALLYVPAKKGWSLDWFNRRPAAPAEPKVA